MGAVRETSGRCGLRGLAGGRRAGAACEAVRRLEEHAAVFDAGMTAEVAIRRGLLVLWLPQGQEDGMRTRTAIELELEDAGDVIGAQLASLGAMTAARVLAASQEG